MRFWQHSDGSGAASLFTDISISLGIVLCRWHNAVLASGSFSAILHEFGTAVGNTFHLVRVEGDQPTDVRGVVHTWVFQFGWGWRRSSAEYTGFPYLSGFGCRNTIDEIIGGLKTLSATDPGRTRFLEREVLNAVPEAEYLTPSEREQVNRGLDHADDLKIADYDHGQLELWRSFRP